MIKREMKVVSDGDLIAEYVITVSNETSSFMLNLGIKQIQQHRKNIEAELLNRGILTLQQIKRVNREN